MNVVILSFYEARSISLIFYFNQGNESDEWEMETIVAWPISTHEKYQKIYGTSTSILYKIGDFLVILNMYRYRYIFQLFSVHKNTKYE